MKVITQEVRALISTGRFAPAAHAAMNGTRKKNQKITSSSGIERSVFT